MRFIILGCGRMGAGLAQNLAGRGHRVTVVDADPRSFERLDPTFGGETLAGVVFDREVLLGAGIQQADGLAAVTDSDEANVVAARVARHVFRVPRVVARLYDPRTADVCRRLGVQTITPLTWGVNRATELLCYSQLDPELSLGGGEVEIVASPIGPLLAGRRVAEINRPGEIMVVAIRRGGVHVLPTPDSTFREGDVLHIAVTTAGAARLETLLALA